MGDPDLDKRLRFQRQMSYAPLGPEGQRRLSAAKALIVGVGGLGTWTAELLARAGVALLRLVDDDRVSIHNLHRQALYREADIDRLKVRAAAEHLHAIHAHLAVEPVPQRLDAQNVAQLADGVDLILDGTDNFPTRFVLNDHAVRSGTPWIFAGVVGAEAQMMAVVPHRTACLRCVLDAPPPRCADPTCRTEGVLGPAVAAVAALQAGEAIKILSGRIEHVSHYLLKFDLWDNTFRRIDALAAARKGDCPCCKGGRFDYLEP